MINHSLKMMIDQLINQLGYHPPMAVAPMMQLDDHRVHIGGHPNEISALLIIGNILLGGYRCA